MFYEFQDTPINELPLSVRFLSLLGSPIEEIQFGKFLVYRGFAQTNIDNIEVGDAVEFTRKEFCKYQEFLINEDAAV